MKTICVGTLKGGCGKTLLSFNLAGYLAKKRFKVLLVDCDPQGNATENCGISDDEEYSTIADIYESYLMRKEITPGSIIIKNPILEIPTLDLIAADITLTATEMRMVSVTARETILKNYIEKYRASFEKYDYIIFDCNPSLNICNQNAMYSSDSILLITDIGRNSFKGVKLLIELWSGMCENLKIENNIKGIVINKYDKRIKLSKDFLEYIKDNEMFVELSFDNIIPYNVKLQETEVVGLPISYYNTKNAGYKAFNDLIKEFKTRGVL